MTVAIALLLGAVPAAQAAPSSLTFTDEVFDFYQLDSDGTDTNTMQLTVGADGRVRVSDSAGITDNTQPAGRCVEISSTEQSCQAATADTAASWRFTPAGGTNALTVLRSSSPATPGDRAIAVVYYTGGSGCDDVIAAGDFGLGLQLSPGAAPAGCTQDISTSASGGHDITLEASAGSNVVTGGAGLQDRLHLESFPAPGVQITEDGQANDGEQADADDNYSAGIDEYYLTGFRDTFAGDGRVEAFGGDNDLAASGPSHFITGNGNDRLVGSAGDDLLHAGGGTNHIAGHAGNDSIVASGTNTVDGGTGNDGANLISGPNQVVLGDGDDVVSAAGANNGIDLGAGNDLALTGAGNDTISGGDGNDKITAGAGADSLAGDGGDDELLAGDGDDAQVSGGDGHDVVDGGVGNDSALSGGANDDSITGGAGDDGIDGGAGDDFLDPGDGTDAVHAGPGDDVLVDTKGADRLDGGEGSLDAIAYGAYEPHGPLSLSLDDLANDGRPGEADNLVAMESLTGGPENDVITGNATENYLNGGDGDDQIDGGGAIDVLRGQYGNDTLTGRDGALVRDDVGCNEGPGDVAVVDANDIAASDCETIDRSPAPAGVDVGGLGPTGLGSPAAPAAAGTAAADTVAPVVRLRGIPRRISRRDLLRKGITVSLGANEPAAYRVRIVGRAARATLSAVRELTLAQRALRLGAGTRKLRLKPSRRLLGGRSRLKLRVVVLATDAAGNRRTVTRTLRVAPQQKGGRR